MLPTGSWCFLSVMWRDKLHHRRFRDDASLTSLSMLWRYSLSYGDLKEMMARSASCAWTTLVRYIRANFNTAVESDHYYLLVKNAWRLQ